MCCVAYLSSGTGASVGKQAFICPNTVVNPPDSNTLTCKRCYDGLCKDSCCLAGNQHLQTTKVADGANEVKISTLQIVPANHLFQIFKSDFAAFVMREPINYFKVEPIKSIVADTGKFYFRKESTADQHSEQHTGRHKPPPKRQNAIRRPQRRFGKDLFIKDTNGPAGSCEFARQRGLRVQEGHGLELDVGRSRLRRRRRVRVQRHGSLERRRHRPEAILHGRRLRVHCVWYVEHTLLGVDP
jgi:hypothetical protein